ncbi:MAG: radical SAM protein [Caldisericum sp.]|uniref:radical SAM protein n=1 Tax=Caldisericum sp. TaxID=2499687 RepID=UPI003D126AB9
METLIIKEARWDITSQCNLKCKHCYASLLKGPNLSFDKVKAIIDKLLLFGLSWITLTGGEPTLRDDLLSIVQYCKKNNIGVDLLTNGAATGSQKFVELLDAGIDQIHFSLDGISNITHDEIRGVKGAFDRTLENINFCVRYRNEKKLTTKIGVDFTLQGENKKDVPFLIDFFDNLGIDVLIVNNVWLVGRAIDNKSEVEITSNEVSSSFNLISQNYSMKKRSFELYLSTFPNESRFLNLKYSIRLPTFQGVCPAGSTIYINPQEKALPCYSLVLFEETNPEVSKYLRYWDVLSEPIEKAMEYFKPFLDFAHNPSPKNPYCKSCPNSSYCRICPLIQAFDAQSIKERCLPYLRKIDSLELPIVKESTPSFYDDVEWKLIGNNLFVTIKRKNFFQKKTFTLDAMTKDVINCINDKKQIKDICFALKDRYNMKIEDSFNFVKEVIEYFYKEEVLKI